MMKSDSAFTKSKINSQCNVATTWKNLGMHLSLLLMTLLSAASVDAETINLVKDINRTTVKHDYNDSLSVGDSAFFLQSNARQQQLWRSSTDSTHPVNFKDPRIHYIQQLVGGNDRYIFFAARNRTKNYVALWRSNVNGSDNQTKILARMPDTNRAGVSAALRQTNGEFLFILTDYYNNTHSIYQTVNGGERVKWLTTITDQWVTGAQLVGDQLFYLGGGNDKDSLWVLDPNTTTPRMVYKTRHSLSHELDNDQISGTNSLYYFKSCRTDYAGGLRDCELFVSDGSAAGSILLSRSLSESGPSILGQSNDLVFFLKNRANGTSQLWASYGTPGSSRPLTSNTPIHSPSSRMIGSKLWFTTDASGRDRSALWRSDGTTAGTTRLFEASREGRRIRLGQVVAGLFTFYTRPRLNTNRRRSTRILAIPIEYDRVFALMRIQSVASDLLTTNDSLVFVGRRFQSGDDIIAYDFAKSKIVVRENFLALGNYGSYSRQAIALKEGEAYFCAYVDHSGLPQLWRSNGDATGTQPINDSIETSRGDHCPEFALLGQDIYFAKTNKVHGNELWRVRRDGHRARLAFDLRPGAKSSNPRNLRVLGDKLVLTAQIGEHRRLVAISQSGQLETLRQSGFRDAEIVGSDRDRLWIQSRGADETFRLWETDGTRSGTRVLLRKYREHVVKVVTIDDTLYLSTWENIKKYSNGRLSAMNFNFSGGAPGRRLIVHQNKLIIGTHKGSGERGQQIIGGLWVYDPLTNKSRAIWHRQRQAPTGLISFSGNVYFFTTQYPGRPGDPLWRLYRYNDQANRLDSIKRERFTGIFSRYPNTPSHVVADDDSMWFFADKSGRGSELWRMLP